MTQNRKGVTDTTGDAVGAGTGSVVGAASGAAIGSMAGPIGTIIGGLAGAVGGWWSGRAISEAASTYTDDDDRYYQSHYQSSSGSRASASSFETTRPAYQLGHLAGVNPDYRGRSFADVEPHLSTAYQGSGGQDWHDVRDYARNAYSRGQDVGERRLTVSEERLDESGLQQSANFSGDRVRDLRDRTGGLADATSDALDDFTDRIDGSPASRPGRDATDRPTR